MIKPKIPKNEVKRLEALKKYQIVNTLMENEYDEITRIASLICQTPVALISFIDKTENFFKSHHGVDLTKSPREISFCGHAINEPKDVMIVNDVRKDERFFDNPLVTGATSVVFYAGVSLLSPEGYPLGTLCVIDHQPKELDESQIQSLKALGNQTMKLLELRKNNKELNEALETQKELSKLQSLFLATASHQFRTPLAIIQSNAELLTMINRNSAEELKLRLNKVTDRIRKEVTRMTLLMDDILILGKITSQKINVEKKPINVLSLSRNLCEQYNLIQEDGRTVEFSFSGIPIEVNLNKDLIRHAISNLLSNAFKYSKKYSPKIYLAYEKEHLKISVSDQGIGIPKKEIKNLFKPFYRAENVNNITGTGLGLAIVKEYVELNNGNVEVQSQLNKGTTFTITFNY